MELFLGSQCFKASKKNKWNPSTFSLRKIFIIFKFPDKPSIMLDQFSGQTQLIILVVVLALLFLLVMGNNHRNKGRDEKRRRRNFRDRFKEKQHKEEQSKPREKNW